jgi:hypothetical protein
MDLSTFTSHDYLQEIVSRYPVGCGAYHANNQVGLFWTQGPLYETIGLALTLKRDILIQRNIRDPEEYPFSDIMPFERPLDSPLAFVDEDDLMEAFCNTTDSNFLSLGQILNDGTVVRCQDGYTGCHLTALGMIDLTLNALHSSIWEWDPVDMHTLDPSHCLPVPDDPTTITAQTSNTLAFGFKKSDFKTIGLADQLRYVIQATRPQAAPKENPLLD